MAAVLLLALVLVSFDYGFGRALFLATAMLPGMFCAKIFLPEALRTRRRRAVAVLCVIAGVLLIEWMSLLLASLYTSAGRFEREIFPELFSNPVFILILLTAFVIPEQLLARYLKVKWPRVKTVTFISDRRKIMVPVADILYVESNDKEVLLHTVNGCYRTRTGISQWVRQLDDRFVRIHRAYLVNAERVSSLSPTQIKVDGRTLDISRSCREAVAARFSG